ncbi:uncharacterized protein LOC129228559 [Uloborus diversus]|uniref:uncharacterized protein LOC129228559 n=1 Tax=Uloborus diversus TaxID=327109 RepID=UPI0024099F86|nr:uncharacterized protein LOC129228559 [Uloborus diversus]
MGDLPLSRITPSRAFQQVGIYFAGPILIKPNLKRSKIKIKSYICLIVCMATKAVHIKLVSDLTTDALIASLHRFFARLEIPSDIHSDNGTNFKGSAKYLKSLFNLCKSEPVSTFCSQKFIKWHFIPPYSPNFGGLWEASIKLTKQHLYKSCKSVLLNFEELSTLLTQIEAIINSRSIIPLSSDPSDLEALTPGHFLIGQPLTDLPSPDASHKTISISSRWTLIQNVRKHFWDRWCKEYLNTLQPRPRWKTPHRDIQPGDLVLVREKNSSPLNWTVGRVQRVFPGPDNRIRVVAMRTSKGDVTRSISQVSVLPE